MTPIVYTKPGCGKCLATYREMKKKGIDFLSIDVSVNEAEAERLQEMGFSEMPVVFGNQEYWTGYRPDKIAALAQN